MMHEQNIKTPEMLKINVSENLDGFDLFFVSDTIIIPCGDVIFLLLLISPLDS